MYLVKAIRKDTNEWVEGYLWKGSNYAGIIPHNLGVCVENNRIDAVIYEVYENTICKAVEVEAFWRDKNSAHVVPLYENDIVQYRINGSLYEGTIINKHGAYVVQLTGYDEYIYLAELKDANCDFINVHIVGNKYNTLVEAEKTPVEPNKDETSTSEHCPYFERRETSYDVLSGHSDYQDYCTKNFDKRIIKCVHCTLCKKKGDHQDECNF